MTISIKFDRWEVTADVVGGNQRWCLRSTDTVLTLLWTPSNILCTLEDDDGAGTEVYDHLESIKAWLKNSHVDYAALERALQEASEDC